MKKWEPEKAMQYIPHVENNIHLILVIKKNYHERKPMLKALQVLHKLIPIFKISSKGNSKNLRKMFPKAVSYTIKNYEYSEHIFYTEN